MEEYMDTVNIEFKMRAINSEILAAFNYINAHLTRSNGNFSFREKTSSENLYDVFSAWQLQMNVEMVFVKIFVFQEYLRKMDRGNEYKVNQKLVSAGLRAYVTHSGTAKDFDLLCLPIDTLVVTEKIEMIDGEIYFTLLSGDQGQKISDSKEHKINLTEQIFNPHFDFVKQNYSDWLS